ncbi:MAG: pyridoxal-phosphate dependent enzyme [Bdellovibrionales bacterium]|nr:pyridoxal-phosphate dependent enzyme [Bdellovibrionales bacterium]
MKPVKSILQCIGNTPMVELTRITDASMARVLVKCEYLLPSGSVKDRMALHIVEQAEREGKIKPGGTLVEATAGNTGLAVAMVAAIKGYRTIFVMPDKFSVEKINMLKAFGSEVIITPTAVPEDHPDSWRQVAKRLVEETPNSMLINQFFNLDNVEAHYRMTGPEIWEQTDGQVDAFVSGAGSGGTVTGAGRYLKEKAAEVNRNVRIVLMDPVGSCYYDAFYKKSRKEKRGWKMEGIGNDFIPGCLDLSVVDEVRQVRDRQAFYMTRRLAREEGLLVGDTSGAGVYVAIEIAKQLGPGKTVVAVCCDHGNRYISKVYNDEWLRDNGFALHGFGAGAGTVGDVLRHKGGEVIFAQPNETIAEVASRMGELGISQMPIVGDDQRPHMMIHESDLLQALLRGEHQPSEAVLSVACELQGKVAPEDDLGMIEPLLGDNSVAVVADEKNRIIGIIGKIDMVKYLSSSVAK